ncbi:hypothetical protein F2P56_027794 [Juglans regia]|uniref:tRNA-binding domain-containing protein n=2 Tax=Juglans regia TaxID=51240 RepID=A0A833X1L5_JUGRE|nr:aminoacyl tRNA synthase complex-interacting multifunctional protein 1 [Juglans regia]KAF5452831.1 hypothetical protein F2P56_027794 [Juglans regia]
MVVAMPLPTNAFASSANVLRGGGALLFSSFSKCSHPLQIYRHRRPLQPIRSSTASLPLFSIGKANETSAGSRRSSSRHWIPSFCTASTSDASAAEAVTVATGDDGNADVDDEKKERMIKEAAEMLDIRVGRILRAWRHEEADSLYVEEVDVGEPQPRIICSGLVNYIPLQHLQDKRVIVLANLKPRNMRGVKSSGMLMAASDASHENVELLVPPEGSLPGERIWFGSEEEKENQPAAATPNQIQKKKIWELVQPHLKTDASCTAMLGVHVMRTSAGVVVSTSLKNANIS